MTKIFEKIRSELGNVQIGLEPCKSFYILQLGVETITFDLKKRQAASRVNVLRGFSSVAKVIYGFLSN